MIRRKVRLLIEHGPYHPGDRADLEQDLALHFLARLPKYDPARAGPRTFAECVLTSKAADLANHARAAKRDRRREQSIDGGLPQQELDALTDRAWCRGRLELAMDVWAALASLPQEAREVAVLLMEFSQSEAVRRSGLSRQSHRTLVRRVRRQLQEWGLA